MRVQILSRHPVSDCAATSTIIPDRLSHLLYEGVGRSFHSTKKFEYLEQRIEVKDCALCWLDVDVFVDHEALLEVDKPTMGLLYMLHGIISCFVSESTEILLRQGSSYLYYFPGSVHHRISLKRGQCRIVYCAVSKEYVSNMSRDYKEIAGMLHRFERKSPAILLENAGKIQLNTLYQMWLVKNCRGTLRVREWNLRLRCVDLLLDYIRQLDTGLSKDEHVFNENAISRKERAFRAKGIIDDQKEGKLDIRQISKMVGINSHELKKIFKGAFNITIGQYQKEARFARACMLLTTTSLPIWDIALMVGYQDESSLSRLFREKLNTSPRAYRMKSANISEMPE